MRALDLREIGFLILLFIPFTIVGTVSHELGHVVMAQLLGYDTILHYGYMEWNSEQSSRLDDFLIAAAGPLQTISVGCLGLFFMLKRRKSVLKNGFQKLDWLFLFLGLFWSRAIFNLIFRFSLFVFKSEESAFGGDEAYLSESLSLPIGTVPLAEGIVALSICLYMVFKLLPNPERRSFLVAALPGSILGFIIWMIWLGPILLP